MIDNVPTDVVSKLRTVESKMNEVIDLINESLPPSALPQGVEQFVQSATSDCYKVVDTFRNARRRVTGR